MYKIVIGVHNNISSKDTVYQDHVRAITFFSLLNLKSSDKKNIDENIIERNDIDEIIADAYKTKAEWLFLSSYGIRILDTSIIEKSIKHAEENNCNFIGHPLQVSYPSTGLGEGEFLIHPQCMLINLKAWKKIGSPKFGEKTISTLVKHIPERSEENIHDDYTPLWIKPSGKKVQYDGFLDTGWEFIQAAMEGGESIISFPQSVGQMKHYLYPELESKYLAELLEGNLDEEKFIRDNQATDNSKVEYITQTSFTQHKGRVYIFNHNDSDTYNADYDTPILDNLYSTASGFKALKLLKASNWNEKTKIGFYDYSKASLNLKKWFIQNWDGVDYIDALKYYKFNAVCECCDAPIESIYQWKKEVDIIEDEKILRKKFEQTVEEFGGKKAWLSFWSKFRNLDIEFIQADVLGDFSSLTEHMKKNKGNNVIWLSNIFFSEPVIRNYRPNFVEEKYNLLVKELKGSSLDIEILGTHPLTDKIYNENTQ
jgi:hypothetical protein